MNSTRRCPKTESDDNRRVDLELLMRLGYQNSVIFESVDFSQMLHSQANLMCSYRSTRPASVLTT